MTRPLLSLCMIVKDESSNIRAVLDAALPHVDRGTILDTGSEDGTQDIVREVFAASGKPLTLVEETFTGFASARNRVLALDAHDYENGMQRLREDGAVFQLMLSGDEYLFEGAKLREHLETHRDSDVDAHFLRLVINKKRQYQGRVTRAGSGWRYRSNLPLELHEFIGHDDPDAKYLAVPGANIEHKVSDEHARFETIWEVHIPALEKAVEEDPEHAQALFYLAQSYTAVLGTNAFTLGERVTLAMRAMSMFARRLALPGTELEHNFCEMQYLDCAREANVFTDKERFERLAKLCEKDPYRPEVALLLAQASMKAVALDKVYELFDRAAKVAEGVETIDNASPISMTCGIEAHYYAAVAAKQLAKKDPDKYTPLVKEHISAGMRVGGSWEIFKNVMSPSKPVEQTVES